MTDIAVFDLATGKMQNTPRSGEDLATYNARLADHQAQAGERLKQKITTATQAALDAFARTRGYDSILSACTYVTSTIPAFAAEGAYCVNLRDDTWAKIYLMLAEVQSGARAAPTSFEDIAHELPVSSAAWPE